MAELNVEPKKKSPVTWIIIVIVVIIILFFLFRGCNNNGNTGVDTSTDTLSSSNIQNNAPSILAATSVRRHWL